MKIFKFGGASIKDAESVKNVANIIRTEVAKDTLVVISAMGKMTNAFEDVVEAYYNKTENLPKKLNFIEDFHKNIMNSLFDKEDTVYKDVAILFGELGWFLARNTSQRSNYVYDQIICFGELLSTRIVSAYLSKIGIDNCWFDVRNYIKTDSNYRDAKVDWQLTEEIISKKVDTSKLNITQGFIAANDTENSTTLGREGSDYTAAIFAYCLHAESVTIWKDVDGVLNADPRVFAETTLLKQISYEEAIEMAFYGASVIHPKTLQPLERKEIPLLVRSFLNPKQTGTKVSKGSSLRPYIPCFIVKKDQILLSISALDFSFMVENNISYIFQKLHDYQLKVNLIQNSAISFSVCIDNKFNKFDVFYNELKKQFKMDVQKEVDLYTVRHFDDKAIAVIEAKGKSLLTQINKETFQIVLEPN
ncbi:MULTISPECIES: aspartate kinase [unclassified Polaribacter]|mgnify:FL=1|jgi:aspartate kinase|uniref:aspartate kinase n=1 Tax=unclassified Polaribacter TaxID=196858 RepID=UPI00052B783D|nr:MULTISPECIES: aspartate kinase [unclassified Polaribacter]KGL59947.1 aspartokinase III [Polaribacter sp. Hel1_33_49]PKV65959.1 aspartate kinase [Polaribacter sp. Hel1_33_96]